MESLLDDAVRDRMRADWNQRAREDAHYYVAFGRRDQDDTEFLSTAADVIRDLEGELKRFSPGSRAARRALEIGCGPGRLLRPMSRHFGEIHGIDVSDEMIAQATAKLHDIPWAHAHRASGSDLAQFFDDQFDFIYSYAVFQHIPSAAVVFSYLRETVRALKPGGFARLQINGLPKSARAYTTWEGVRISADEIHAFTKDHDIRLLSLTGVETQYMWTSWQKPPLSEPPPDARSTRIRHVVNAFSGEQAVPSTGRLACATLQIEAFPEAARDLNSLAARIDGAPGVPCYIGPSVNGLSQLNVFLPAGVRTGLVPVRVDWRGDRLCPDAIIRIIPAGPSVPRLVALSDGVNLLSAQRIESGTMKATIDEVEHIDMFTATVDGVPVRGIETFRTDPLASRYEVNFHLPRGTKAGGHVLHIHLGARSLTRIGIEVV
ncbi:MAG TPA: class I SAM-dependent methyltransferase [Bryobacteraceae bacterium]|nr:class I SAM-dependent methyltransferase [Bryobacteraceae bacterium]